MPVRYCKNCIWGFVSAKPETDGIECTNPELENVQKGSVMPLNAKACPLYKPLGKKKRKK
ncbi:MAG: hypothetical protein V3U72_05010 [Candidatus Aenigmarchaeota archaeon]